MHTWLFYILISILSFSLTGGNRLPHLLSWTWHGTLLEYVMTVACRLKVYSKLLVCTVTSVMFFPLWIFLPLKMLQQKLLIDFVHKAWTCHVLNQNTLPLSKYWTHLLNQWFCLFLLFSTLLINTEDIQTHIELWSRVRPID